MSLISMKFVLFTGIAVGGYYLIPKKAQWVWLLVASYVYYLSAGAGVAGFLLFSTAVSFLAALWMEACQKRMRKNGNPKKEAPGADPGSSFQFWNAWSFEIYQFCN